MKKNFDQFNIRECINTNIKTILFFILIIVSFIILDNFLFKIDNSQLENLDNGAAYLIVMLIFEFSILFALIIYSFIVILKAKIYKGVLENLKSLIGLIGCNIGITFIIEYLFTVELAFKYISTVAVICSITFLIKYKVVNKRIKRVSNND